MKNNSKLKARMFLIYSLISICTFSVMAAQGVRVKDKTPSGQVENPYAKNEKPVIIKSGPIKLKKTPSVIHKPLPKIGYRKVKTYTIPGPLAVTVAKRHGYSFKGDSKCEFNGSAWMIQPNANKGMYCKMDGFSSSYSKQKCRTLRKGWEIKKMKFSNSFEWMIKYRKNEPSFRVTVENKTQVPKMLMLKSITLVGPSGPTAKFEEAFSHCDDPDYRS